MNRETELIANIQARRDYIRNANLTLTQRQAQQRQIKAWERELAHLGGTVPPEPPRSKATSERQAPALRVNAGYVVVNDQDQPGQAIHASRDSCHVVERYNAMGFVREATQDELDRLGPCGHCLKGVYSSGWAPVPLTEPQGDSARHAPSALGGSQTQTSSDAPE